MLTAYLNNTRRLLQNPSAPTSLYSTSDLTDWINTARLQLAGEANCVRVEATISTVIGQRPYNFSGLNTGVSATTGVQGALNISSIKYASGSGGVWIPPRPWEWFNLYYLNVVTPVNGPPKRWAQYGQGSAGTGTGSGNSGSFYLDPPPDAIYALTCNTWCYPIALVVDGTVEAIPYPWTDAVPYYAAYLALLSAQTGQRQNDAERMFARYTEFVTRARTASNPSVERWQYQQAGDPVQANKLGVQTGAK